MFRLDADKPVHFCDGLTRRDFLHAGSLGVLGLTLPDLFTLRTLGAVNPRKDVNCILLMLVGAPSQLDTWDMKPDAPAEIRGPYKPDFGDSPAHGQARGQVRAGAICLSQPSTIPATR